MGKCIQWSGLILVWMAFGLGMAAAPSHDLARDRRQSAWWNAPRSQMETGWGSSRMNTGGFGLSRQLQESSHPIRVQCMEDTMVVTVQTDLYGIGKPVKASDLSLGPGQCRPSSQSTTTVIFQQKLQECGNALQMTPDWLFYSTNLVYTPTPVRNSPIVRTNAATVLIQCSYSRHQNVSSKAIKPTWIPFSSTISSEERLSFSLTLMTGDWSAPRTDLVFQLGDIFHIEASVDVRNHMPMKILVDSCVATLAPDTTSSPRYEIIAQHGCLMDGTQEDASSAFRSPRPASNRLQFTVDAFRFTLSDNSMIYITCNLRAAAEDQVPSPTNKACSFSKDTNTWVALEGTHDICRCCDSATCISGSRSNAPFPGHRRIGKRELLNGSPSEHGLATLGPLLVIGADKEGISEAVTQSSGPPSLWVLVAIVSSAFVVVIVTGTIIGKRVTKKCGQK